MVASVSKDGERDRVVESEKKRGSRGICPAKKIYGELFCVGVGVWGLG